MIDLAPIQGYIRNQGDRFLQELQRLVRQPSVSSQDLGVAECAELIAGMMEEVGVSARVIPTRRHPVVYGEIAGRSDQTLLIYNHYDVQPADPVEAWSSPPFEARLVDGRMVGRGTTDSKGNLLAHLKAIDCLRDIGKVPPCRIKFIFDGEEEIGSPSLPTFLEEHRELLRCDAVLHFDGGFDAGNRPRLALGSSGLLYVEIRVRGGRRELHSARARLVVNPAWRLVWALASLKGPDGRILIDGFYDNVLPPTSQEQDALERMPWDDDKQREDYGVDSFLGGVSGVQALQTLLFQPTCNISGISGGFTGRGVKTILPNAAAAKIDFRLVCNQDPEEIYQKLTQHLRRHGFEDFDVESLSGVEPSRSPLSSPIATAVARASEQVYGVEPAIKPTGEASGRSGAWIGNRLGVPSASTGVGPPSWRGHAADEFITVEHFLKGIEFALCIWENYAG